jgi:hypothetical protein
VCLHPGVVNTGVVRDSKVAGMADDGKFQPYLRVYERTSNVLPQSPFQRVSWYGSLVPRQPS